MLGGAAPLPLLLLLSLFLQKCDADAVPQSNYPQTHPKRIRACTHAGYTHAHARMHVRSRAHRPAGSLHSYLLYLPTHTCCRAAQPERSSWSELLRWTARLRRRKYPAAFDDR